eukprot:459086-Rhodomonas_salina.1
MGSCSKGDGQGRRSKAEVVQGGSDNQVRSYLIALGVVSAPDAGPAAARQLIAGGAHVLTVKAERNLAAVARKFQRR